MMPAGGPTRTLSLMPMGGATYVSSMFSLGPAGAVTSVGAISSIVIVPLYGIAWDLDAP